MRFMILMLTLMTLCLTACYTAPEPDPNLHLTAEALATENAILVVENATLVAELPTATPTNTVTSTILSEPETIASPTPTLLLPDEQTPVPVCQLRTDWPRYTVQTGDTLFSIAQRIGSTVAALQNGNCLGSSIRIDANQQIYLPSLPPTLAPPTATPETGVPTIHSYQLVSNEAVGQMHRVTVSWQTSGGQAHLTENTRRHHYTSLEVPASGTHTFELFGTYYENPPITLSIHSLDNFDNFVSEEINLAWPCEHPYFFGNVPSRCAAASPATTLASQQDFENGRMLWLAEFDAIIVLYDTGTWKHYDNVWQEGDPPDDPDIQPPPGFLQPIRGFGEVWRNPYDGVRDKLGWAVAPEQPFTFTFQQGLAESVGQGLLYLTLQDGVTVHELTGFDVGIGTWSTLP